MASSWQVTGQVADQFQFDGAGNPTSGYRVSFITGAGNRGSVFVPEDHYTPEHVRTMVAKQAGVIDAVGSLASQG